ncbi:MAG: type II secretion system protein [Clostridia bacterium]|nr:type II secretion system protein [Clostridia bacterium]
MFKEERGITLVALVVTIIVLLILAGVTITLALGSNGVIGRAQEASNTWANATKNEQAAMTEGETHVNNAIQQYVTGYSASN